MRNPLIPDILELLYEHAEGISEYALIQALEGHEALVGLDGGEPLSLFQLHFLVMNALYTLQQQLWQEESCFLEITPLHISLSSQSVKSTTLETMLSDSVGLGEYYLDWDNLEEMTATGVEQLLEQFWKQFAGEELRATALDVLGLEPGCTRQQVVSRYRQLAARHHPDKGGETQHFVEIRKAYEQLCL